MEANFLIVEHSFAMGHIVTATMFGGLYFWFYKNMKEIYKYMLWVWQICCLNIRPIWLSSEMAAKFLIVFEHSFTMIGRVIVANKYVGSLSIK